MIVTLLLGLCVYLAIEHWRVFLGVLLFVAVVIGLWIKEEIARDEDAIKREQQRREELKKCWAEERRLQEEDKKRARLRQQEELKEQRQQLLDGFKAVESWCRRSVVILDTSVWLDGYSLDCDFAEPVSREAWRREVEQFPGKSLVALLSSQYCQGIKVVVPNLLLDELEEIKTSTERDSLESKGAVRALQRIEILQKKCKINVFIFTKRETLPEFLIRYADHMRKMMQKHREAMASLEIVTLNVELAIRLRGAALGCDKIHVLDRDDIVGLLAV